MPRRGMVWIGPGSFVAGTPVDVLPRIADEEMPGVQVVLNGYYIDQYPHPNESGAIQTTNVTVEEAELRCGSVGKRLCTELEWERACKGPDSTTYEYGSVYNAQHCLMGKAGGLSPSGTSVGCRSGYDVGDMHGGAFEWTSSKWNRGAASDFVVVRGGSSEPGDVFGRCANARARRADRQYGDVGFRCCAGDRNEAEVFLEVDRPGDVLKTLSKNSELVEVLEGSLPDDLVRVLPEGKGGVFRVERVHRWYPIGNEQMVLGSGCAHPGGHALCGVIVARQRGETTIPLVFVPSGWWLPSVQQHDDRRMVWVYGGDGQGKYRRKVAYMWGRIGVGEPERGSQMMRRR